MRDREKIARAVGILDLGKAVCVNLKGMPETAKADVMRMTIDAVKDALKAAPESEEDEE